MICTCLLPSSTPSRIIIPPISPPYLCGLSEGYSSNFPLELSSKINRKVYEETIAEINCIISVFWPCFLARICGFFCCPCTVGFSLLVPFSCIKDAEKTVKKDIKRLNGEVFRKRGLEMKLEKRGCVSWLEIEVLKGEIEFGQEVRKDYFEELL